MWWIPLAMGVGSMINEKNREDNLEAYNEGQAEMTKYSPWTGVRGQIKQDTGPGIFGAGISGAVSGLGVSQQLQGMGGGSMGSSKASPWSANDYSPQGNTLDFNKYRMNRFSNYA